MLFFVGIFIPVSQLRYSLLELETKPISAVPPQLFTLSVPRACGGDLARQGPPFLFPSYQEAGKVIRMTLDGIQ